MSKINTARHEFCRKLHNWILLAAIGLFVLTLVLIAINSTLSLISFVLFALSSMSAIFLISYLNDFSYKVWEEFGIVVSCDGELGNGAVVQKVVDGFLAEGYGFRSGDVLAMMNNVLLCGSRNAVHSPIVLRRLLDNTAPVKFCVLRRESLEAGYIYKELKRGAE